MPTVNVAHIHFELLPDATEKRVGGTVHDDAIDRVYGLLGALRKNGNIVAESPLCTAENGLTAFATVPERAALESARFNAHTQQAMEKLRQVYCYSVRVLGHFAEGLASSTTC